jgi:hypothetical protein
MLAVFPWRHRIRCPVSNNSRAEPRRRYTNPSVGSVRSVRGKYGIACGTPFPVRGLLEIENVRSEASQAASAAGRQKHRAKDQARARSGQSPCKQSICVESPCGGVRCRLRAGATSSVTIVCASQRLFATTASSTGRKHLLTPCRTWLADAYDRGAQRAGLGRPCPTPCTWPIESQSTAGRASLFSRAESGSIMIF